MSSSGMAWVRMVPKLAVVQHIVIRALLFIPVSSRPQRRIQCLRQTFVRFDKKSREAIEAINVNFLLV
jgi:hypothetical protein